jgi:hypothetical protein
MVHQFVEEDASRTGEHLLCAVPSPSFPYKAWPQAQRVPSVLIAKEWHPHVPAETAHQFVDEDISRTGEDLSTTVPSPNAPHWLRPHDQIVPSDLSAAE